MVQGKDIKAWIKDIGLWDSHVIIKTRIPILLMRHIPNTVASQVSRQGTPLGRLWALIS
jgi:hypothetical protein